MNRTLARWAPLALGFAVAVVCWRLGFWQLERLGERRARNAELEARLEIVSRTGTFDFAHQQIVMLKPKAGVPGVYVATPLVTSDSAAVLVERGWVPSPDGKTVDLAALEEPAEAMVEGYFAPGDSAAAGGEWPAFVRAASPAMMPHPRAAALVLKRTRLPDGAPGRMRPMELPDLSNGPHLSYAIQWFAFGVIALVGSGILFARQRDQVGAG